MHIKQVTIQGFRSYKDQTAIGPFSKKHNVVVGKNGSGKSNFFKAIQFVLGDESEFGRLGADTRQNLLHEGAGSRITTAYAEVVFDNSDSRIPVENEEVVLRRTIAAKQDQYTLNGKTATKQDVANLLETAGFSKSNPYYIVKQGKVNELSTAAAEKRLALLYEVAGTKVYDERRAESQEGMKESAEKSEQIRKAITNIEDRLKTLEEEKEDLKKYQQFDKKRRLLEHTVFTKDLEEVRGKVQILETKREDKDILLRNLRNEMRGHGDEIQKFESELRKAKSKVTQHEEEKRQVLVELEEHHHRHTQLELAIKDTEADDEQGKDSKATMENELRQVKKKIEQADVEILGLTPAFNAAVQKEETASKEMQIKKQQRTELFAKQSRGDRFKSQADRDKWLNNELRRIAAAIKEKETALKTGQQKLEDDRKKIKALEKEVKELEDKVTQTSEQLKRDSQLFGDDRRQKEELVSERNELYRQDNSLQTSLTAKRSELSKRENELKSLMGKTVLRGVESVRKILEDWAQDANRQQIINGYCGMLIEVILCKEPVYTAVDTIAQNKLFYHIVETDTIASEILEEVNRRKLPGEVNFLPLNRLRAKNHDFTCLDEQINGSRICKPLINMQVPPEERLINYSDKVENAVRFVFGKVVLCRSLDVAGEISKQYHFDCVTPDGDTVNSRGLIYGGYVNRRESRILLQSNISAMNLEIRNEEKTEEELQLKLNKLDGELQAVNSNLSSKETKLERLKAHNEKNKLVLAAKKEELRSLENGIEGKEKFLASVTADMVPLKTSKDSMDQELLSEMTSVLSEQEQQEINKLDSEIRALSKEVKALFDARRKLEVKKNELQSTLQEDLYRRRDELQANLQESSTEDVGQKLLSLRREKNVIVEAVTRLRQTMANLDTELDKLIDNRRVQAEQLEKVRGKEREIQEKIVAESRDLDKIISKLVLMQKEKDDCLHKLRELVSLPAGFDNSEYMRKSLRELGKDLEKINEELKKFGHVNQRALDQYVTFSEQRTKLLGRQEELDRGAVSITNLMQDLEQQKFEAIMLTFQQVTRNFELVFKELVPHGRGNLTLLKGNQESSIEDTQTSMEELDNVTGIGVKVSFTGGVGEMKDMHQLSGGQKTLVALATIFAIQKCDPAPFYLFDEIDQALDPDHRKSVGRMVGRLSHNAQFITTTFRPELLDHADEFFGVTFDAKLKVSKIFKIQKTDAQQFIADDDESEAPNTTDYDTTKSSDPSNRRNKSVVTDDLRQSDATGKSGLELDQTNLEAATADRASEVDFGGMEFDPAGGDSQHRTVASASGTGMDLEHTDLDASDVEMDEN